MHTHKKHAFAEKESSALISLGVQKIKRFIKIFELTRRKNRKSSRQQNETRETRKKSTKKEKSIKITRVEKNYFSN